MKLNTKTFKTVITGGFFAFRRNKFTTQVAAKLARDEEARKKVVIAVIIGMIMFLTLIIIPYYIASQPLSYFSNLFGDDTEAVDVISNFKSENNNIFNLVVTF